MKTATLLHDCKCFARRRAARQITKLYERHLGAAQLTTAQHSILETLDEQTQMTMNELAGLLVMDRTTLLRANMPMQREGLLSSRPHAKASRQLVLSLSPAGRGNVKEARVVSRSPQQEFEARVGPARAARMRRELLTLARQA
jgi:DNA-binding MarR family transcriptional regulator